MQINNISTSSTQKKSSYFEKYRKELQRISEEMKNKNQPSKSLAQKQQPKQEPTKVVIVEQHQISNQSQTPPTRVLTKKSLAFQPPKQTRKNSIELKEQAELALLQSEAMKEVQALMGQLECGKKKVKRLDEQIHNKRCTIESLKLQISHQHPMPNGREVTNYSERMLAIQTRMKFKKELHQDQLNRLVNEKNIKHSENVQLSKFIQTLEEQLSNLTKSYLKSEDQQPVLKLRQQTIKIQNQIQSLNRQCGQIDLKINNSEQLKVLSINEFKRYAQVYKRQLIGREITQSQERIKDKNHQKRYLMQIQKKKMLIKQKKVDNFVRHKSVIEMTRVIDHTMKQIDELKRELAVMSNERKNPFQ